MGQEHLMLATPPIALPMSIYIQMGYGLWGVPPRIVN
jgi:hypothetical protein